MVNTEICEKAIRHWGTEQMLNVCMEELAELIQSISKYRRYGTRKEVDSLVEEMADVNIILEELLLILWKGKWDVSFMDVQQMVEEKQNRTLARIRNSMGAEKKICSTCKSAMPYFGQCVEGNEQNNGNGRCALWKGKQNGNQSKED